VARGYAIDYLGDRWDQVIRQVLDIGVGRLGPGVSALRHGGVGVDVESVRVSLPDSFLGMVRERRLSMQGLTSYWRMMSSNSEMQSRISFWRRPIGCFNPAACYSSRVPAHPSLVSPHDEFLGRRSALSSEELAALVRAAVSRYAALATQMVFCLGPPWPRDCSVPVDQTAARRQQAVAGIY